MKTILYGWNVMRVVRLVVGCIIVLQGIFAKDSVLIILGIVFGGMALANFSCCGVGGCTVNVNKTINKNEDINYEEVGPKK